MDERDSIKKIVASKGKVLRRISDGFIAGPDLYLGYTYYLHGEKLDEPLLELPELNTGGQMEHTNGEIASVILPLKDENTEKESIIKALQICNGHREQAARLLKINPATLYRKMKKYDLR